MLLAVLWKALLEPAVRWLTFLATKELGLSPSICIQASTSVYQLALCMDKFTVPHAFYDPVTYDLAQPVGTQREDWTILMQHLLDVDSFGGCAGIPIPSSLKEIYTIERFQDFCVLHETSTPCGTFSKGWGYMVVPAYSAQIKQNIHLSAPHPGYDLGTVEQAAAIFEATGSRSLLVAGRTRTAFLEASPCIAPSSSHQDFYATDPAHNNLEPFVDASFAIYHWQHQRDACPSSSCAFIQMHGKAPSTCTDDIVFLSSGLGNSTTSKAWYKDDIDRPVKRIQHALRDNFPSWNVSLPSDSNCSLTATKNVVGRHLNGVEEPLVCRMAANNEIASGMFVHAEQASIARGKEHYEAWSSAITAAFEPVHVDVEDRKVKAIQPPERGFRGTRLLQKQALRDKLWYLTYAFEVL